MAASSKHPPWLQGLGEYLGLLKNEAGEVRRPPWVQRPSLLVFLVGFAVLGIINSVNDVVRDRGFWAVFHLVSAGLICVIVGVAIVRYFRERPISRSTRLPPPE
jgi:hypothetical protein